MTRLTRYASILGERLDAEAIPVDPNWGENNPVPNVGYRKPLRAEQIEAWAEAEYLERTEGMFAGMPVCPQCREKVSQVGVCACGVATEGERIMAAIFGIPVFATDVADMVVARPEGKACEDDPRRPGPRKGEWELKLPPPRPTAADLPDLPEDASPEEVAAWREMFLQMRQARR